MQSRSSSGGAMCAILLNQTNDGSNSFEESSAAFSERAPLLRDQIKEPKRMVGGGKPK